MKTDKKVVRLKVGTVRKKEESLPITTPFIKLESALKLAGIAQTGGQAKMMIQNGEISVNGEACYQRGKKLKNGDVFSTAKEKITVTGNFTE